MGTRKKQCLCERVSLRSRCKELGDTCEDCGLLIIGDKDQLDIVLEANKKRVEKDDPEDYLTAIDKVTNDLNELRLGGAPNPIYQEIYETCVSFP